ncbi:MAG TPA: hypothetical protein DDW52_07305 [Planctomycetaceae bacterium]|nr:hypothetical protein [Planctomycetaceae bacterium]
MSFLHISLLAGLVAVSVPVMLHLFGNRQPKQVVFPALRFVVQTARKQSSSWRLRHFLLLLLRCLLIAIMALAIARPRVHSAMLGSMIGVGIVLTIAAIATLIAAAAWVGRRPLTVRWAATLIAVLLWIGGGLWCAISLTRGPAVPGGDQSAPVAAAIVIDTSPTMRYVSAGKQRIANARELVKWLLGELPPESRVGILAGAPVAALSLDPAAAMTTVDLVDASGSATDLVGRIRAAVELVSASELERKEVYVVSDLTLPAWEQANGGLAEALKQVRGEVLVQVVDVGDQDAVNWGLGDPQLDATAAIVGSDVTVTTTVTLPEAADEDSAIVELYQEAIDPTLPVLQSDKGTLRKAAEKVIDRQVVELGAQRSAQVEFNLRNLAAGSNNFRIKLVHEDPLKIDNERFVSIAVEPPQPTLVVAQEPRLGQLLTALVNPFAADQEQLAEEISYAALSDARLESYKVVCLYDPPQLSAGAVDKLYRHTAAGGGLLTILGPSAKTAGGDLSRILPGVLKNVGQRDDNRRFFQVATPTHPVLAELSQWSDSADWSRLLVFSNWEFESLNEGAFAILTYSDSQQPALTSHAIGRGLALTLTTPIPEPETRDRELWNLLWVSESPYLSFGLLVGAINHLSGFEAGGSTQVAGRSVTLSNDLSRWPAKYSFYASHFGEVRKLTADEEVGELTVPKLEQPGFYWLRGQLSGPVLRTLSANVPAAATQLDRLSEQDLDSALGEDNYRLATNRSEITSSIGQARFGRELFPLFMLVVAALFLAEQAMSNRFYNFSFAGNKR